MTVGMADVLVLCYHAISPTWTAPLSVTPRALELQLGWLVRRGYRGVTFAEAVRGERRGNVLSVTFDDAFASVFRLALPVLAKLGLPATVFVPSAHVEAGRLRWPGIDHWAGTRHEGELAAMSWDLLSDLAASGWEIGSHTVSHPRLTELGDAELVSELRDSRTACEDRTGRRCASVAYPYGDVDGRVVAAARRGGYLHGAALPTRWHQPRPLEWPRVGVYHRDRVVRFGVKASSAVRAIRQRA